MVIAIVNVPGLFDDFSNNLELALSTAFYYDHQDSSIQETITNQIKHFYFDDNLTMEKFSNITNVSFYLFDLSGLHSHIRETYIKTIQLAMKSLDWRHSK